MNQESCIANMILSVTHAMSDGGGSEPSDIDFQSQQARMISILTDHFRCLICSPNAVNIWSPPPPRCSMCTSDIVTCAPAIEETDNEEHIDGEHVLFPRNRRDVKADAVSLWHLLTHNPLNRCCPICQMATAQNVRHVRGPAEGQHSTTVFGDCITADYFVFDRNSEDVGLDDMINGLVVLDAATGFLDCEPSRERDAEMTAAILGFFAGGSAVKRLYTNDDGSFKAAAREFKWRHENSKPHDPQANGLIEVLVGIVKSGARALLFQAGMPALCWRWAVKYFCQ